MPVYEFICQDCGTVSEVRATVEQYSVGLAPTCGSCGSNRLARTFTSIGLATGRASQARGGGGCAPGAGPGCCYG